MTGSDVIAQFVAFFSIWHSPGCLSTQQVSLFIFSHSTTCFLAFFSGGFQQTVLPKENKLTTHNLIALLWCLAYFVYLHLVVWWTGCVMRKEIIFQTLPCGQDRRGLENMSVLCGGLLPGPQLGLKGLSGLKGSSRLGTDQEEVQRSATTLKPPTGSDGNGKPWVLIFILMPLKTQPDITSDKADQMRRVWTLRSAILTV